MARTTRSGSVGRESLPQGKRTVWFKYQRHRKEKRKITELYCLYIPVPSVHHIISCRCWIFANTSDIIESFRTLSVVFPYVSMSFRQTLTALHVAWRLCLDCLDSGGPWYTWASGGTALHNIQLSGFAEVISGALVIFSAFEILEFLVQSFIGDSEEDWATSCLLAELQAYLPECLLHLLQDATNTTESTTSIMRRPCTSECWITLPSENKQHLNVPRERVRQAPDSTGPKRSSQINSAGHSRKRVCGMFLETQGNLAL